MTFTYNFTGDPTPPPVVRVTMNQKARRAIEACAAAWDTSVESVTGARRTQRAVFARHAAMVLIREIGFSLHETGDFFKRDHGTVCYAARMHRDRIETPDYFTKFHEAQGAAIIH